MKTTLKFLILTGITVGLFNIADAQRSHDNGGRDHGSRSSGYSQPHMDRGSVSSARSFPRNDRNGSGYQGRNNVSVPQRNETSRTMPVRNFDRNGSQGNVVSNQAYSRAGSGSRGYDNYRTNNYYTNNYYRSGYNGYHSSFMYGHYRTSFMYGPRYSYIPHNSISIYFDGSPYYYNQGYFYGYYGGFYQPIFPPFGLRIGILPFGYSTFYIGGDPFYYYNGIYYRPYDNSNYEVVDAPMGATVSSLPRGAKKVIVNGETLYELNGTYYKADRDSKGNDVYTVVGKNGEINNTDNGVNNNSGPNNYNNSPSAPSSLQVGDVVNQLPEGSKIVTINGDQVYQTPDDTYLKEENNNGTVQYRVVGK